jgi:hypothetical protein
MEVVEDEETAVSSGACGDVVAVKNVTAKPDRPAEKPAEKSTAKKQDEPEKSTAKLPQKPEVERATAKTKDDDFAVGFFDDEDEDFADVDFFAVDKVDSKIWRIEKRYYHKQDGSTMLHYNYRKRKGKVDKKTGKRINEYKSGGKRAIS